jgi:arylsulfatase
MSKSFRSTKLLLIYLALVMCASPLLAETGNPSKPNIVLVLMDNFGYGEVGVYGGGVLRGAATPRIDSLAEEGARFTNP